MPAYAGFTSIQDYLDQRLHRERINQSTLSEALGWRRNYLNHIYHGRFTPSRKRCNALAHYFGDDPHIIRVLVGHEAIPSNQNDKFIREVTDLAASIPTAKRREALRLLRELSNKQG